MKKEQLKDYHLFSHNNEYYLLNIDDMTSFNIDKEEYEILNKIKGKPFNRETYGDLYIYLSLLNLINGKSNIRKFPAAFPVINIMLNITQDCNLNCRYCYGVGGEYGSKGYMSRETACKSVDWLISESGHMKNLTITFFGGEPLLNFTLIEEVINYGKAKKGEKNITFGIVTNGTILNDEIIKFLKKHNIRVNVSFDALPLLQNHYRPFKNGGDSYEIVRKNISKLIASGVENINITSMVTDENINFKEVRDALINTGCRTMGIHSPSPPMLKSNEAENIEIFNKIKSGKVKKYTERLILSIEEEGRDWLSSIKERNLFHSKLFSDIIKRLFTGKKREYFCMAGKKMVNIAISGDIYPCHRFNGLNHMKMGHIENFNAKSQKRYIENHISGISECSICQARYFCGGGCIYDNLVVEGSIDKPYGVWCDMMKKAVELGVVIHHQLNENDKDYLKRIISESGSGVGFYR
jgi:uncharacterized protein